ncbi:DNA alkylation repair protein [Lishizhenia sp.]
MGWSLRQYSKYNPEAVKAFLAEHDFSTLARREGSKYL